MTSRRLLHAAAVRSRTVLAGALAAVSAGLCAGCIGTVPVVTSLPTPGLVPTPVPVPTDREELRALEPDHWGDG